MGRTKGSTNKPRTEDNFDGEKKTSGRRGRQKGEVKVFLETLFGEEFKTKEDSLNRILLQKSKPKENEDDTEEDSEPGWKVLGYFQPRESSWQRIFEEIVQRLKMEKAKKESVVTFERHKELQTEAERKAIRLFEKAGFEVNKKG